MQCACCDGSDEIDASLAVFERTLPCGVMKVLCSDCSNQIENIIFQSQAYNNWSQLCEVLRCACKRYEKSGKHRDAAFVHQARISNSTAYVEARLIAETAFRKVRENNSVDDGDGGAKSTQPSVN